MKEWQTKGQGKPTVPGVKTWVEDKLQIIEPPWKNKSSQKVSPEKPNIGETIVKVLGAAIIIGSAVYKILDALSKKDKSK